MNLWDKILLHTERRVNPHSFATWFRPTRMERLEEDRLVVRVPTRLFCKRLTETYGELLQAVITEIGKPQLSVGICLCRCGACRRESRRLPRRRSWISNLSNTS